jgi:flagellar protein FlbD
MFALLDGTRRKQMIQLTRLNNQPLTVNSDLIKFVEQSPDTLITLTTGEKIVVRESVEQVLARIVEFRRSVLAGLSIGLDKSTGLDKSSARVPALDAYKDAYKKEPER